MSHKLWALVRGAGVAVWIALGSTVWAAGAGIDPAADATMQVRCDGDYRSKRCGYVDAAGREVIPIQTRFAQARPFSEGLAAVVLSGTGEERSAIGDRRHEAVGYIDVAGAIVIPPRYRYESLGFDDYDFRQGLALVKLSTSSRGIIDRRGHLLVVCGPAEGSTSLFRNWKKGKGFIIEQSGSRGGLPARFKQSLDDALQIDGATQIDIGDEVMYESLPLLCDRVDPP